MIGSVLMRYGLDADGKEISGVALCASKSYKKVYERIRAIYESELNDLDEETERIFDYDSQIVVEYPEYSDEAGVRYIIESLEIL